MPNTYTSAYTNGCFQLSVLARKVSEFNLSTAFESIDVFLLIENSFLFILLPVLV